MKVSTRQCRRIALMIAHEKIGQSKIIAHEQPVTLIPISTIATIQPMLTWQLQNFVPV